MRLFLVLALAGGGLAGGFAEMRKLSDAGKPDDALAVGDRLLAPGTFAKWREAATAQTGWKRTLVEAADPLFAAVGLSDLSPVERAAVHFERGVVLARAEKRGEAGEAFEKARAFAGPGDLRLDATYDLAWTALEEGETQRKRIPELGGTPPAPPAPSAGAPPAAAMPGAPPAPDPLQLAKAAYLVARDRFVERLKADASDSDSRANVELAQKRLKELAEIEKKREEERKKQEQEKKDQQQKDQKDQKDKQDKNDQDSKDKDKQKQDDAKDPNKDQKSDEQKKKDEQKQQDEQQKQEQDKKKDAKADASKEEQLTKEEVMRLLDTLKDREEEGKRLLEQRKRANRARVKKDW